MRNLLDKLFTGAVLLCLVSSSYVSYYLRPWRWLSSKPADRPLPSNPYAQIPLPETAASVALQKEDKEIA